MRHINTPLTFFGSKIIFKFKSIDYLSIFYEIVDKDTIFNL